MQILSLGEKIKLKRKEKNMKLKDLAGDRITPGQISLIETGKSNPSEDLLKYLADKLETKIEYFLETEEKQAEDICKFYFNIIEAAILSENYLRAEENIEKGIHYALEYNVELYNGKFTYQKAYLSYLKKQYNDAQQHALSSVVIFLRINNPLYVIKGLCLLGNIAITIKEYSLAYNYFKEAEKTLNNYDSEEKLLKIQIYYNISKCLSKLKNYNKSIDYAMLVENEVKQYTNTKMYAETLMMLAIGNLEKGENEKAMEYATKAREVCFNLDNIREIANIEEGIGEFFVTSLNVEEGLEYLNRAFEIKKNIVGENTQKTCINIIRGLIKVGKYDEALDEIQSLEMKIDLEKDIVIKIYEYKYKIYKEKSKDKLAEIEMLNLIKYLEGIEEAEKLIYYYMLIATFYREIGEEELAFKFLQKAFVLQDKKIDAI